MRYWLVFLAVTLCFLEQLSAQTMEEKDFDRIRVDPSSQPSEFDLRERSIVSGVRTQSSGGCWASSSNITAESWIRMLDLGDYRFSDRNLQRFHGFDQSRNTYGNHYMATAYYSRGSGPVLQDPASDTILFNRPQVPLILSQARYLPGAPELIKQTLMDYGPVYSMLYFKRNAVDTLTYILNSPENPRKLINHVVVLVGWDDDLETPSVTGAWLAQNSLGTKFGDNGFFFIPYNDKTILQYNAIWTGWDPYDTSCELYYYDTLGSFNSYGFHDSICYGLVRFEARSDAKLIRLASHINHPGSRVRFEVYTTFDDSLKTLSGKIGQTEQFLCTFPGYYTFPMPQEINLMKGTAFYVMAEYIAPGTLQPLPVEQAIKDYSYPGLATASCWINPNINKWPDAWYACGKNSPYPALDFNLNIRAITKSEK